MRPPAEAHVRELREGTASSAPQVVAQLLESIKCLHLRRQAWLHEAHHDILAFLQCLSRLAHGPRKHEGMPEANPISNPATTPMSRTFGSGPLVTCSPCASAKRVTASRKRVNASLGRYVNVVPLSSTVP